MAEKAEEALQRAFGAEPKTKNNGGGIILTTPLYDPMGDPITLGITRRGNAITVDDAGAVAAMLFSLGRDEEDTPQMQLLTRLANARNARLDYAKGAVTMETNDDLLHEAILNMTTLVATMLTAAPHL